MIIYRTPEDPAMVMTRRVTSIAPGPNATFVVQTGSGATSETEPVTVSAHATLGRLVYALPRAGTLVEGANQPLGRALFFGVPGVLLASGALRKRLHRPAQGSDERAASPAVVDMRRVQALIETGRRALSPVGPFAEVVVVDAATTSFGDASVVDGATYSYEVFGLSGAGGMGTGSLVATAIADATSPSVLSATPATSATDVALNSPIGLVFSEPMNQPLTSAGLAFVDCGASATCASGATSVPGDTNWLTTSSLTFSAAHTLDPNRWYGLQLSASAADITGNALECAGASVIGGGHCTWTFQTGSTAGAPGLASSVPAQGANGVPTNASMTLVWTEGLGAAGQSAAQSGFSLPPLCARSRARVRRVTS